MIRIQISQSLIQMKDELLPQIPQENIAQTQSMYDQLRKTSQKWFSGSNKRIFTNSNLLHKQSGRQKSQLSERVMESKISEWQFPQSDGEKMKLMSMMREQIEIGCELYTNRIKSVLQDQAKKIKILGDLLVKNKMELNKKNKIIDNLVEIIERNASNSHRKGESVLNEKIASSEQQIQKIFTKIEQIQHNEDCINLRIKQIQKLYRQKLSKISNSYAKNLKQLSQQFEERVDKAQKIVAMNMTESKYCRKPTIGEMSTNNSILKALQSMQNELEDVKIEIQSFKKKRYRYENYKFEEVQIQINKIYQTLEKYQNGLRKRTSPSPNLKSSQTTHMTRTQSNFLVKNSSTSKTRFLNKYKSLINTRQQNHYRKESCSSESQSQSEVQETIIQQQSNIQRLKRIILQNRMMTPVKVEIDQTGYAKSTDTGMYLVDALGNGFQFTNPEIQYLTANRIIKI